MYPDPDFSLDVSGIRPVFDSPDDRFPSDAAAAALAGSTSFTIALRVRYAGSPTVDSGIFAGSATQDGVEDELGLRYDAKGYNSGDATQRLYKASLRTSAGTVQYEGSSFSARPGEWQHLTLTWTSGDRLRLFIDGVEDIPTSSATLGGSLRAEDIRTFMIGVGARSGMSWNGELDDLQIWSEQLTSDQIRQVAVDSFNAPPVAADDTAVAIAGLPIVLDVLANDVDADGDALTLAAIEDQGALVVEALPDGRLLITPATGGDSGIRSFTYTVVDAYGIADRATVSVPVVNPPLVADPQPPTDAVFGEAFASRPAGLVRALIHQPEGGRDGDGALRFTGGSTWRAPVDATVLNGAAAITVVMRVRSDLIGQDRGLLATESSVDRHDDSLGLRFDAQGYFGGGTNVIKGSLMTTGGELQIESSSGVQVAGEWIDLALTWSSGEALSLYINGVLNAPSYQRAAVTGTLIGIEQLLLGQAENGTNRWSGDIDGFQIFDRALSAQEIAAIAGRIPANDAPQAAADTAVTTAGGTIILDDLLANDRDPDGDALALIGVEQPAHGLVYANAQGALVYEAAAEFSGIDRFTVTIGDGRGGTDTAEVAVTVRGQARDDVFDVEGNTQVRLDVLANDLGATGARVTAVEAIDHGHLGLAEDGSLVFRAEDGFTGVQTLRYTLQDRTGAETSAEVTVRVTAPRMQSGWGEGDHYKLAVDSEGFTVVEAGRNHRMLYVSMTGSANADGLTEATAVNPTRASEIMKQLYVQPSNPGAGSYANSWHVLMQRGQDFGTWKPPVFNGESALNPYVIGAWGEGERPVVHSDFRLWGTTRNVVIKDLELSWSQTDYGAAKAANKTYYFSGIDILGVAHQNLLFENLVIKPLNGLVRVQSDSEAITFRRVQILDNHRADPADYAADFKAAHLNRTSGLYAAGDLHGLLIEESVIDHNGWEDGYRVDGSGTDYQPPSQYSHNLYLQYTTRDVTLHDNVISNAASFGVQGRGGAVVDGNVFFGNNAAITLNSGNEGDGVFRGNSSRLTDSVFTEPSNKDAIQIGARGWGVRLNSTDGMVAGAIIANDGNGYTQAATGVTSAIDRADQMSVQDLVVYNWGNSPSTLAEDPRLTAWTLEAFAKQSFGPEATIATLIDALRDRDRGDWADGVDAEAIVAWFKAGFGQASGDAGPAPREARFEAFAGGDGFRWDNRFNWTRDAAPRNGDAVDLNGHQVIYGGESLRLTGLDLGSGGDLIAGQGRLEIVGSLDVGATGGALTTTRAGQIILYTAVDADPLTLTVAGGRLLNGGVLGGTVRAEVSDGQMILATSGGIARFGEGASLTLRGDSALVGFDGQGGAAAAIADFTDGDLAFVFDDRGVSRIGEFRSGAFGPAAPAVQSVVDLGGADLTLDLRALDLTTGRHRVTLIEVDQITGNLRDLDVALGQSVTGVELTLDRDAGTLIAEIAVNDASLSGIRLDGISLIG